MSDADGGPAFPTTELVEVPIMFGTVQTGATHHPIYRVGMSLRDYFAGQALATRDTSTLQGTDEFVRPYMLALAAECYAIADAMLAERAKGQP